jgi:hypothetical protein
VQPAMWGPGGAAIWQACRAGAWQGLRGWGPVGRGCGSPMQSWGPAGPEGWGARWSGIVALRTYGVGTWWASCSFSRLCHGEAFHDLGVQSAEVSALPGALPQPSVSSISARPLIHRAHAVCGCVAGIILDPLNRYFEKYFCSKGIHQFYNFLWEHFYFKVLEH